MNLSEAARVHSTSYGITIFNQKDITSEQYGYISQKEINNPRTQRQADHTSQYEADNYTFQYAKEKDDNPLDDSKLKSFEEDDYSKHQKRLMYRIIQVN